MDKTSEIKKKMKEVIGVNPNLPFHGVVTEVTGETCKVKLVSGLEIDDVRLKATVNEETNFVLVTPEVGSDVLLLSGDGSLDNVSVIKIDKVSKFAYTQSGLTIEADSNDKKVLVKNDDTNLYELFDKLTTILKEFKVFTPVGPSGTALTPVVLKINEFETKFKQLLKAN